MKLTFLIYSLLFITITIRAGSGVKADPDYSRTGYEFNGTSQLNISDYFNFKYIQFGGMVEIRNENSFDTKFLPNHNWRGYLFIYGILPILKKSKSEKSLEIGFEHESAHSTMGVVEENLETYLKIYDHQYRLVNLNSLLLRYNNNFNFSKHSLLLKADYQFYLYSKNTPEITGKTLTNSNGLSLGIEYSYPIYKKLCFNISLFDRYIFQGIKNESGIVFQNNSSEFISYPVITSMNTIAIKSGISFGIDKIKRNVDLYISVIYGNIFGFVDSRDKRLRFSGGICLCK